MYNRILVDYEECGCMCAYTVLKETIVYLQCMFDSLFMILVMYTYTVQFPIIKVLQDVSLDQYLKHSTKAIFMNDRLHYGRHDAKRIFHMLSSSYIWNPNTKPTDLCA